MLLVSFTCLLWGSSALGSTAASQAVVSDDPQQAAIDDLLRRGLIAQATNEATRWLAEDPTDPDRWWLVGHLAAETEGAPDPAWNEALALSPAHLRARRSLAAWLLAQEQPDQALALADDTLALHPGDVGTWEVRLQALAQLGDPSLTAAAEQAIADGLASPVPFSVLGHDRAALAQAPDDPALRGRVALLHLDAGEQEQARALADAADWRAGLVGEALDCLDADTLSTEGWRTLRDAGLGELVALGMGLGDLPERTPDCALPWLFRAGLSHQRGEEEAALTDLRHAAELPTAPPRSWASLGLVLAHRDAHAQAVPWLERAANALPRDAELHLALADSLEALGRVTQALDVLDALHARLPTDPDLPLLRARLLRLLGRDEVALTVLRRKLQRHGPDPVLLMDLRAAGTAVGVDVEPWVREAEQTPVRPTASVELDPDPSIDETIEVFGEGEADRLYRALVKRLEDMGYDRINVQKNRTVLKSSKPITPFVILGRDGSLTVQKEGLVNMPNGEIRYISPRKMRYRRERVLRATHEMRQQLLAALAQPDWQAWVEGTLPELLDALWQKGTPMSEEARLRTHEERRQALLAYWSSRTCTPQGEVVRQAVARFLRLEVQNSAHPATEEELSSAEAACACGAQLPR